MKTPRPRALTYTEMMNGGRQQLDPEAHQRELDVARRTEALEDAVAHLEHSFDQGNEQHLPDPLVSNGEC
ncbi:MAG: hypothetical protein EBZ29_12285 [Synechococcaceae bacterium WB9_4xC_028]|nr:hypothetical protein [Synechococcaceae bacterium WB9_4xC_028]